MKRSELKRFVELQAQCADYRAKVRRYTDELLEDKQRLSSTFGRSTVDQMLSILDQNGAGVKTLEVNAPSADTETQPIEERLTRRRKRRRRSKKNPGYLGYSEVRPYVLEAVQGIGEGQPFTKKDIEKTLSKRRFKFDPGHISLILMRDILGVEKTDREKHEGRSGTPLNIFKVKSPPSLRPSAKLVTK